MFSNNFTLPQLSASISSHLHLHYLVGGYRRSEMRMPKRLLTGKLDIDGRKLGSANH